MEEVEAGESVMCCYDENKGPWWQTVPVDKAVVTFGSEREAINFLAAGTDRLHSIQDWKLYHRLQYQRAIAKRTE